MLDGVQDLLTSLSYEVRSLGDDVLEIRDPFTARDMPWKSMLTTATRAARSDQTADVVVVEDDPPESAIARVLERADDGTEVISMSRFVDRLWGARLLHSAVEDDADGIAQQVPTDLEGLEQSGDAWYSRHLSTRLVTDEREEPAHIIFDRWMQETTPEIPIIYAEAGTGKTELLTWLARRASKEYANAVGRDDKTSKLPPIMLRVPLKSLRAPNLLGIAEYVDGEIGLIRVSGAALSRVLLMQRLVLLLDGLDEVNAPLSSLRNGLGELQALAADGARIAVSCRSIAALSSESELLKSGFGDLAREFVMPVMKQDSATKLLVNYGAPESEASRVYELLPSGIRGIPLYLLLGWASDIAEAFAPSIASSRRAQLLRKLITTFCAREEERQGFPAEEQLKLLSTIALESSILQRPMAVQELRENLLEAHQWQLVDYPHGLLRIESSEVGDEEVVFRSDYIRRLLIALRLQVRITDAIRDGETEVANFLVNSFHLSRKALTSQTLEHLGELLSESDVSVLARVAATRHMFSRADNLTRNLMYIALVILEGSGASSSLERGSYLAKILSTKSLSGARLTGLNFENIDFDGWDLRKTVARATRFSVCRFTGAEIDRLSLIGAQYEACIDEPSDVHERQILSDGAAVLDKVIGQLVVGESETLRRRILARELGDNRIADALRASGLATRIRAALGTEIELSNHGLRLLSRYRTSGTPDRGLEGLLRLLGETASSRGHSE